MDTPFRPIAAITLGALLLACQGMAHGQEYRAKSHVQRAAKPAGVKVVQAKQRGEPAIAARLYAPAPEEMAVTLKNAPNARATRIGFSRATRELADDGLASRLQWQELPGGGRIAHFSITSADAAAVRVGIAPKALPLDSRFRFHDGSGRALEVRGEDILESIAANLEAGEQGANARTWWSPVVDSSTAVVEVELPAGTQPSGVRFGVPGISHLVTSAKSNFALPKIEASCALDAKCHENMWGNEMNAEARMLFTRDGTTYACSGTLLADQDSNTEIPYFHTAGHCISNQRDASTVATYWFYRSNACNSGAPSRYEVRSGGAQLLYVHQETDTTLLQLNEPPPAGAVYLGWNAGALTIGAPVTGIHHGSAEQKLSFGDVRAYAGCLLQGGMCMADSLATGNYYYVTWRAGVTLGGSSGSPLIADNTRTLVGHLSSGMSACGSNQGDFYGRFDIAYKAGLNRWLGSTPVAVVTPVPAPPAEPRDMPGPRLRLTTTLGFGGAQRSID